GHEEHLGRGGVRELGQEVMLHLPDGVVAELVGEDDLLERLVVAAVLAALVVRLRHLELVEEVEFHGPHGMRRSRHSVQVAARRGRVAAWRSSHCHAPTSRSTSVIRPPSTRGIAGTTRARCTTRSWTAPVPPPGASRSTSVAGRASSRRGSTDAAGARSVPTSLSPCS